MSASLIPTIQCKIHSGLLSVSFLSSSPFSVFTVSDTAPVAVILKIGNGNKKILERAKSNDTQHAARLLFSTCQRCCGKQTAADSGGKASKHGNRVKKRGAGRTSVPALMQERDRLLGSELTYKPRTTSRTAGRGATVVAGLEIPEVPFNSCLGK